MKKWLKSLKSGITSFFKSRSKIRYTSCIIRVGRFNKIGHPDKLKDVWPFWTSDMNSFTGETLEVKKCNLSTLRVTDSKYWDMLPLFIGSSPTSSFIYKYVNCAGTYYFHPSWVKEIREAK